MFVSTCNASISACEKRKQWQQALGLPRSFDVFFPAISACEKGEQRQQALDLVVTEQSVELLPDVITCNASPAGEQLSPHSWEEPTIEEKTEQK